MPEQGMDGGSGVPSPGSGRRVVLVSRVKRNPYVSLLAEGLRQPDLGLRISIVDRFSLQWLWRHRREIDVLHFHWLELLFIYPTWAHSLRRWTSVALGLLLARLSGIRIVYTLHNVWQHEGRRRELVWLGNLLILALAHAVHVHDRGTADSLAKRWGRRRGVRVIPHGNYVSAYPNNSTFSEARRRLGLEEVAFVYLCLGRIRPYKGIEELVGAFKALEGDDAVLLIAGEAQEPSYARRIRGLPENDDRIRLALRFVDGDSLQFHFGACDICVLPYRHVTSSGAALLSFSFGQPIIAPRMGCLAQLVGNDERGILYDPETPDGLLDALRRAREYDLTAMRASCRQFAEGLNWDDIARRHATVYRHRE